MNNLKLATLFTVLITWSIALLFTLSTNQQTNEKVSNKSIISVDTHINTVYIEYTDDIQAIKDHALTSNLKELEAKRKVVLKEKRIAALKLAEEKRVAEAKRIAEEKRQIELAKVAEENRIIELAKIEEEKRVAALVAKREAKNKEKKTQVVSVSRGNSSNQKWVNFEATHYTAFCEGCSGKTALGWNVKQTIYRDGKRIIAVDPSVIPLGSLVEVKTSYGTFIALAGDTGGDIKGHRADILVEGKDYANSLGRIIVQIRIIK